MNSQYEGYALLLEQHEEMIKRMDAIRNDMSFLWMNIKKGNFNAEETKSHALKELGYMENSLKILESQAKRMNDYVGNLRTLIVNFNA